MLQQNFSPGEAPLRVIAAGLSDIGRVRERNEDAIAICEPLDQILSAQFGWLYLLADGAGGHGHAAGEVASKLAVETIAAAYYTLHRHLLNPQLRARFSPEERPRTWMVSLLLSPFLACSSSRLFLLPIRVFKMSLSSGKSTRICSPPVSPL